MVVSLGSELFNQKESTVKIDSIFNSFLDRKYILHFDDDEVIENSYWANEARTQYKELLVESFINTLTRSIKFDIKIDIKEDISKKTYSLDNGLIYLNNDVIIFLENASNDSYFIKGLIAKFIGKGKKIKTFINKRWIRFENCGGKDNSINQIQHILSRFDNEPLDNHLYVRSIVILDSDKKNKEDTNSNRLKKEKEIIDFCLEKEIKFHILEKREMENYLPLDFLKDISQINQVELEKIKLLSQENKDYYDMEKLSTREYNTKQELPKLFVEDDLTQKMLVDECKSQENKSELGNILDKINSIL